MERAVLDRLERQVNEQVKTRFPADAVRQAIVLGYGDDPVIEPGELMVRVVIEAADGPGDDEQSLEAFTGAHRAAMREFRQQLEEQIPEVRRIEFVTQHAGGQAKPSRMMMRIGSPAERDRAAGEVGAAGEAMENEREGALPGFFLENPRSIGIGFAGVDDQRQAGGTRRCDMGAKPAFLCIARTAVIVVVETGLANRHHLRVPRADDEVVRGDVRLLMRVMRMCADRAIDLGIALRDRKEAGKAAHAGRDTHHAH